MAKRTRGLRLVMAKARARKVKRGKGLVRKRRAGRRVMKH